MASCGYSLGRSEGIVLGGRGDEGELMLPRTAVFYDFAVPLGVRLPVSLRGLIVQAHGEQALDGMAMEWEADRIMVTHLQRLYIFLEGVPSLAEASSRSSPLPGGVADSNLLVKVLVARILEPRPQCAEAPPRPATVFHDVGGCGVPLRIRAACTLNLDLAASRICMQCPGNQWFEDRTLSFMDLQHKPCANLLFGAFWEITSRLGAEFILRTISPLSEGIRVPLGNYTRALCQAMEAVAMVDPLGAALRGVAPLYHPPPSLRVCQLPQVPAPFASPRQGILLPKRMARASRSRSVRRGTSSSRAARTSRWVSRAAPVQGGMGPREAMMRIIRAQELFSPRLQGRADAGHGHAALQLGAREAAPPGKGSTWRRSAE